MHSHCLELSPVAETKEKETAAANEDDDDDDCEVSKITLGGYRLFVPSSLIVLGRHAQLTPVSGDRLFAPC